MVYLAKLLVIMMGSKFSEFLLEMYRVHGHKRLDDDGFLASLLLQNSDGVVLSIRWGAVLLKHNKTLAIANRSRVSCAHDMSMASMITP